MLIFNSGGISHYANHQTNRNVISDIDTNQTQNKIHSEGNITESVDFQTNLTVLIVLNFS